MLCFLLIVVIPMAFLGDAGGKELTCQCRRFRDVSSIPRLERWPGEGDSNPLQYSCLENPMNRRAWWVIVHETAKSFT